VALRRCVLRIVNEGRARKLVRAVEQITFNGGYAAETSPPMLDVTERRVFRRCLPRRPQSEDRRSGRRDRAAELRAARDPRTAAGPRCIRYCRWVCDRRGATSARGDGGSAEARVRKMTHCSVTIFGLPGPSRFEGDSP
jgi:hypothetical protein